MWAWPFSRTEPKKYKHGHWTINHSCILSTPVKDLFCEIVALFSFLFFCRQACYLETRISGAPIAVIWKPSLSVYNVTIHFEHEELHFPAIIILKTMHMSKLEIHPIAKRPLLILSAASPTCALVGGWIACATMAQCHRTLVRIFTFHNQEADSQLETSQFQTSEIQII